MVPKRQVSRFQSGKHPADVAAFEVAYALMRVAGYSANSSLSAHLQSVGFALVSAVAEKNEARTLGCLHAMESYLRLGEELGEVHAANIPLILTRAHNILPLLRQEDDSDGPVPLDLWPETSIKEESRIEKKQPALAVDRKTAAFKVSRSGVTKGKATPKESSKEGVADSATLQRQAAIAELIRQKANCRMKDIQEEMPDVSERTLRYDISALIERGEIERVGAGGPFSYYKAKDKTVGSLSGVTESKGAFILPL